MSAGVDHNGTMSPTSDRTMTSDLSTSSRGSFLHVAAEVGTAGRTVNPGPGHTGHACLAVGKLMIEPVDSWSR